MHTKSLLLVAPHRLEWVEQKLPPLAAGEILVETRAGAVSIGSELPLFRGTARSTHPARYPRMTGYESVGLVREAGPDARRFQIGDRVVATYGHRTHAIVVASEAILVPSTVSDELALLTILAGDVATGVRKLGPVARDAALVTGGGAIGLLALFVLQTLGASRVDVAEPLGRRRELALALGADHAVMPEALCDGADLYDAGVECSSSAAGFLALQERIRPGGRICVLADGNIEPLPLAPAFHERQLTVVGSSDCPDYQAHARWYFDAVQGRGTSPARLFDLHVPAAELPTVFDVLAENQHRAIKVLVSYPPDRGAELSFAG